MVKRALISTVALMITGAAYAYPAVGTSTSNIQPNRWTSQFEAAKARANQLGLPMLVALMSNGCSQCANWDARVLSSSQWTTFLNDYPMILVMLDFSGNPTGYNAYKRQYFGATASILFPTIAIHSPTGGKVGHFLARGTNADPGQHNRTILGFSSKYYGKPGSVGFQSGTLSVDENYEGGLLIPVARTDGNKGAVTLSYTITDGTAVSGTHYTAAASGSITWDDKDSTTKYIPVSLLDDGRWTAPEQRTFTVALAKSSGDATLGTSVLAVTIQEAEPYAPGVLGFATSYASVIEGNDYHGTLVRTGGAVGAAKVSLSVPVGYSVTPEEIEWSDADSDDKPFTVSGIDVTPEYDERYIEVTLGLVSGAATLGVDTQVIDIYDQIVTETFEDYTSGRPLYQELSATGSRWFYNEDDGLRTAPLAGGESSTLSWTAPGTGRLTFVWRRHGAEAGIVELGINEESYTLDVPVATNTLALASGEGFSLLVDHTQILSTGMGGVIAPTVAITDDLYATFEILGWEPLNPVVASAGTLNGNKLQIDFIRSDNSLADLTWNNGSGNSGDTSFDLLAGSAATTLAHVATTGGNLLNGVDEGIVDLDDAQGWIFWQVNAKLSADYGSVAVNGPVWSFAVIDLPLFTEEAPDTGSTQNAFLKAGASIQVPAFSATPVTYSATGLPAGLTINPQTGVITGTARSSGTYSVTVNATNSEGSTSLAFTIRTQDLPAYVAKANFNGAIFESTDEESPDYTTPVVGALTVKATKTGKLTAKVVREGKALSFKGAWLSGSTDGVFSTTLSAKSGDVLDIAVGSNGILLGALNGQQLLAREFLKGQGQSKVGYYTSLYGSQTLSVNSGSINNTQSVYSYLTLNISKAGKAKYSGILSDGAKVSGSSTLLLLSGDEMASLGYDAAGNNEYAAIPVFAPLYGKRGSASLIVWIDPSKALWADSSRWHYPGKSARLTDDGFVATLQEIGGVSDFSDSAVNVGGVYNKSVTLTSIFRDTYLVLEDAYNYGSVYALPTIAKGKAFSVESRNDYKAKLSVKPATGLFSGSFTLTDPATNRGKGYKFKGAVRQDHGFGLGAYQVPDAATGAYKVKRSYGVQIIPIIL